MRANYWTGGNIKLTCSAQGENQTQISWYKDWVPLKGYKTKEMVQREERSIATVNLQHTVWG